MIEQNNKIERYSKRVVVFMDILGFKNIVGNANEKDKLFKVMNYLKWLSRDNYKGPLSEYDIGKELTVFSDSIVISYDVNSLKGSVFYILLDIIHIQLDLAFKGVIVRGGVSIGDLYHEKEIIFGPAMIKAYQLESLKAKYPRIIVDKDVIKYAYLHPSPQNTSKQEKEYVLNLLAKDKDGYFFTDFLNQEQELDDPEDIKLIIVKLKDMINEGLKHEEIREKYKWLESYLNEFNHYRKLKLAF